MTIETPRLQTLSIAFVIQSETSQFGDKDQHLVPTGQMAHPNGPTKKNKNTTTGRGGRFILIKGKREILYVEKTENHEDVRVCN